MKSAILLGANGFVGSYLLQALLNNDDYEKVTVVVRKNLTIQHTKLTTLIGDFTSIENLKEKIRADEIFLLLGTTVKQTPDKLEYYKIDHDYPVLAAKIAKDNGATSVFVVTAIGANSNSSIFYNSVKGDVERDIRRLNFEHTHIFQPSMIMGNRKEKRPSEKVFIGIFKLINFLLIGKLNKFRGMKGENIALAINNSAQKQSQKVKIYQWNEINKLL